MDLTDPERSLSASRGAPTRSAATAAARATVQGQADDGGEDDGAGDAEPTADRAAGDGTDHGRPDGAASPVLLTVCLAAG
jgi:hypothetical protein